VDGHSLPRPRVRLRVYRPSQRDLVAQWLDVREIVVAGAARFAVERATAEEFAEAKRLLRRLVATGTRDEDFVATGDRLVALMPWRAAMWSCRW
jgi:DNA-binding GntR family transcriptional regulator